MQIVTPPEIDINATFDDILQGRVHGGKRGDYYHIERLPEEFNSEFELLAVALKCQLPFLEDQLKRNIQLEDLLFIDIETTGLSPQRPLFLIGTLSFDLKFRLQLFLARHHQEEAAALEAFSTLASGKVLITFNGRFFDWPYIEKRCQHHHVPLAPHVPISIYCHMQKILEKTPSQLPIANLGTTLLPASARWRYPIVAHSCQLSIFRLNAWSQRQRRAFALTTHPS